MSTPSDVGRPLTARGLTLRTAQGTVFGPVDLDLPPGVPGVVLGTQGSGRSALLLALVGRMQGASGHLRLGEVDGIRHPHRLRRVTAVAHISGYVELEPALTVAEAVDERCLLDGLSRREGRRHLAELQDAVGFHPDPRARVGSLPAEDVTVLTCLLACLRPAEVVVYDDLDTSLTVPQLERVHRVLDVLCSLGHRFVVSALASSPVPPGAVVLALPTPGHEDPEPTQDTDLSSEED